MTGFTPAGASNSNGEPDISASYSNVQYIAGSGSKFFYTQIWNTGGIVLHYKPLTVLDLAAGYSYTRATEANGITSAASYQQFTLSQYYSLSKRTGLYFVEAYQLAGGQTLGTNGAGDIINATADIGDGQNSAPSSPTGASADWCRAIRERIATFSVSICPSSISSVGT
ncbi:outer membrane protein (porin) [Caballeronia udeis]|uniref:Outer membrane protein (Porin) n=1 Tax=Caballeronia udeis TaxID=1232866 RepID=A0A158JDK9_9BURK|nr:outer membrane protein (porin) [Caballeronia udeis]